MCSIGEAAAVSSMNEIEKEKLPPTDARKIHRLPLSPPTHTANPTYRDEAFATAEAIARDENSMVLV